MVRIPKIVSAAALLLIGAAGGFTVSAVPEEEAQLVDVTLDLPSVEDSFYRDVVGEIDVDDVHLTSSVERDGTDAGRDHRHHHGHVRSRNLQIDSCEGYPSLFKEELYVTLNDVEGSLNTESEFNTFVDVFTKTLEACSDKCLGVKEINILAQFFLKDRRRRKKWKRLNIIKAWTMGICYQCSGGEAALPEDSIDRLRRLAGSGDHGTRRRLASCAEMLRNALKNTGMRAFECLTIVNLSITDPRCFLEDYDEEIGSTPVRI